MTIDPGGIVITNAQLGVYSILQLSCIATAAGGDGQLVNQHFTQ